MMRDLREREKKPQKMKSESKKSIRNPFITQESFDRNTGDAHGSSLPLTMSRISSLAQLERR